MQIDLKSLSKLTHKLLPRFIGEKLADYTEPSKKGTPKGDPVGFPRAKYQATLLALRQKLLGDKEGLAAQAKELNVSYGVLRKWRSESQFKEMVAQHEKEFLVYVLWAGRHRVAKDTGLNSAIAKDDLQHATTELIKEVHKMKLERPVEGMTSEELETEKTLLLSMLARGTRNLELAKDIVRYQTTALENAIQILSDRTSAIKHRKQVVAVLESVRDSLN